MCIRDRDHLLTLLSLIPMAFLLVVGSGLGKVMVKKWEERQQAFSDLSDFAQESYCLLYTSPSQDAAPYVKVGDPVKKGQVLAIVEAMKLMNEIESDFDGTVAEVYVKNGESVEYGMPLFRIV